MIEIDGDHEGRLLCDEPDCPWMINAIGAERWEVADHLINNALASGWIITRAVGKDDHHYCPDHDRW